MGEYPTSHIKANLESLMELFDIDIEGLVDIVMEMYDDMDDSFMCVECSTNTFEKGEYYMVHDHLWQLAGMKSDGGMLCFDCLESRLGRKVTIFDFTDAPINDQHKQNPRFKGGVAE